MVAKRSYPYEDYEQGLQTKTLVTEKVFNSTKERMPMIYEQTLSKLVSGSKDYFRTRSQSFPGTTTGGSTVEGPTKECSSCHRHDSCRTSCTFCDGPVCDPCVRQCRSCSADFCQLCSIVCYGPRTNTAICFSCK